MALSDLVVYSEYAHTSMTEVLQQQIDLFNAATQGAIVLGAGSHQGDFSDKTFFPKIAGLIRRRNPYGSGSIGQKTLTQLIDTMVKVAAGTPEIVFDKSQFDWIKMNPQVAGAALGQQLAVDTMADMLNTALAAWVAAHTPITNILLDITGRTTPADKLSFLAQNEAAAKLGDGSGGGVVAWVSHSKPMFDLYQNALTNTEKLFTYGTVNVIRDPFGRAMVMSDSPALINTSGTTFYNTLGLQTESLIVHQNDDYNANEQTLNGKENISTSFQAEWSFELGMKGFTWDKVNGGKAPTDAALFTSTNWDRTATYDKELGGVIIKSH